MPTVQALFQRATSDKSGFTTAQNIEGSFLSFDTLSDAIAFTSGALASTGIHPSGVVTTTTPKGGASFFYSGQLIFISSSREFYEARFTEAEALGANNPPNDSASLHLVEFPVSLINTSSLIAPHQTSSFVLNSQTSSFVTNSQTSSFVVNSQTGSFVTNAQTSSFVVNSQTSSFVTNAQTSSFVVNSQTGSFVVNSQTGSFVVNSQTSSFVTNAQTSSFITDSIFTTFTSSFTDKSTDSSQVRITIDAIPSESIFTMREISSGSFGTKASGSITVGTDFGTNNGDTLYLDLDTGFVLKIRAFTAESSFNSSIPSVVDGGALNPSSTTNFLLTASKLINENSAFGITANKDFTCDKVAGILSSSVNSNTLNLIRTNNGTFGNEFRIASHSSTFSTIPGTQTFGFGGGSAYNVTEAQSRGDEIANVVVLDISGSNDNDAALRRMDLLSFLQDTFIVPVNDKLDSLLQQYNSANNKSPNPDLDGSGTVDVQDILTVLAKFGESVSVEALPTPESSDTAQGTPDGGSSREGLKSAGGVVDQGISTITNGSLVIGNQSSGSLVLEGTEFLTTPAKLDFLDKIGGSVGDSGSGVFTSSGSLFFHSESIGSFRFNRPLSASNLSGTNTGDQDLSSYIQNSQTGSFITNSQTSSFALVTQLNASSSALQTNIDNKDSFTHITASGNISASGDIIGFTGSFGHVKTSIISASGGVNVLGSIQFGDCNQSAGEFQAFSNIGMLGTNAIFKLHKTGKIDFDNNEGVITIGANNTSNILLVTSPHTSFTGHITASANISASGELIGIIDGGSF